VDASPAETPSFETVATAHGGMLWRIASSYELDPDRRRDLHQDILFALWKALPHFRGDCPVAAFAARVAHNRGVSHVAREAARPRERELDPQTPLGDPSPEETLADRDRRERLTRAIHALPLALRQPTVLTLEGFHPREIADILGLEVNAVSIRLTRAKALLRPALKED
jgi:RNA polymerase sigma-70 factor (ECF subfamily)